MYVLDTSALYTLGHYYPLRFPTIWEHIDSLIQEGRLWSVREVRREIENNCPFSHIESWTQKNRRIFRAPNKLEMEIVAQIFRRPNYLGLVSRNNMLKGLPVADPFIIAAAKAHKGIVVTQETFKDSGARIPTVCREFDVACINVEQYLETEQLKY